MKRRRRTNITKQEAVVTALWAFADNMQHRPNKGQVATNLDTQTKLSLEHIGSTLTEIMDAFGYALLSIQ